LLLLLLLLLLVLLLLVLLLLLVDRVRLGLLLLHPPRASGTKTTPPICCSRLLQPAMTPASVVYGSRSDGAGSGAVAFKYCTDSQQNTHSNQVRRCRQSAGSIC
jgi:hypothetical protein